MPEARILRPAALGAGLVLLVASLWQLLAAFVDPSQPRSPVLPVAALAALAGSLAIALPTGRPIGWAMQAAAVAVSGLAAALAAALLGGQPIGPLQLAVILGGLTVAAAAVPGARLIHLVPRRRRSLVAETAALMLIVLVFGALAIRNVAIGAPMGWDESVYGLTARSWVAGTPLTGWALHRSPGMPALGTIPLLFVQSDAVMRGWGVAFGMGMIVAVWAVGRRAGGSATGLLAAAAVASVPDLQADAGRYLTDVPSTALLLTIVLVLLWQLTRPAAPGRGLMLAGALAAAAFYVRYGSSVPIALVGVVALVAWFDRLRRVPALVGAAILLLGVLIAPNLITATLATGKPWGVALSASHLAAPAYPGQALPVYAGLFGGDLAGSAIALLAWAAIVGWLATIVDAVRLRRATTTLRILTLLVAPAIGQGLLLGIVALPQTRYIFFPIVLLTIGGSLVITRATVAVARGLPTIARAVRLPALVGIVVIGLLLAAASGGVARVGRDTRLARSSLDIIDIGTAIAADAAGRSCSVLTYLVPEVTWYTRCAGYNFHYPARIGAEEQMTGTRRYLLLFTGDAGPLQPGGPDRDYYLALAESPPLVVIDDHVTGAPNADDLPPAIGGRPGANRCLSRRPPRARRGRPAGCCRRSSRRCRRWRRWRGSRVRRTTRSDASSGSSRPRSGTGRRGWRGSRRAPRRSTPETGAE